MSYEKHRALWNLRQAFGLILAIGVGYKLPRERSDMLDTCILNVWL